MTCPTCKIYEEVIDELTNLLKRSQRQRRRINDENRKLLSLIVMDMEKEHEGAALTALSAISQADGYVSEAE